jgi:hypothetical protein
MLKFFALILGIGQSQSYSQIVQPKVYHHYHPATETLIVNGKVVSRTTTPVKPRKTIDSLTKEEFVNYYKKSKNIICL